MKFAKDKTVAIALILLLTVSAAIAVSNVQFEAHAIDFPTFPFATASPNPVGVGQACYLGVMFSRPQPTASGANGDRFENTTIDIVDPDGVKVVMGPYLASMAAGIQFTYTPSKVGNYTIQAHYPGEILDGRNPESPNPGGAMANLRGSYAMPADSNIITLVVQEDWITSIYKTPPLPTEFWTRPIYSTNWNWAEVGANWFGLGGSGAGGSDAARNFQPDGSSPKTAHIMWKCQPNSEVNRECQYLAMNRLSTVERHYLLATLSHNASSTEYSSTTNLRIPVLLWAGEQLTFTQEKYCGRRHRLK
jgi:hypothetical protein